ncbi:MAG: hypothetical protein KTR20_12780 [Cellvibrionaceae bacterium]|nr:hypothetical protein [Cellvibrionaceae bacterium]
MLSFLKGLFAGPETGGRIARAVIATGDAVVFTDEERSQWYLNYLEATQPQNRARRLIAVVVSGLWAFLVVLMCAAKWVSDAYAAFVFEVLSDVVMQPFSIILGFYFLKTLVTEVRKPSKR